MIPILFSSTATDFSTRGLGPLSDCISCTVTEQRNGIYELEMQYPLTGLHYSDIADRSIILAIPSPYREAQPFRVYQITRNMNGTATIYAQHLSYDLAGIPVTPFSQSSLAMALTWLKTHSAITNPFSFSSDFSSSASFGFTAPTACRSLLGGVEGSLLDVYGGEYEFDGYDVILHRQRGGDNGVTIRYGKNLTDLSQDSSTADMVTGIYPYWQDSETGALVTCSPAIISASGTYNFQAVTPVDFTADFEQQPTPEQLKERAERYISDNSVGVPSVSLTISFAQIEQMSGYEDLSLLERCDLCDTVTVQYPELGVSATAKIVSETTDVLLERYTSMELGSVRSNLAGTINGQQSQINGQQGQINGQQTQIDSQGQQITAQGQQISQQQSDIDAINGRLQDMTDWPQEWSDEMQELAKKITGQTDSHVIFRPMEYPAVIIIAESTDLTSAGNSALYLSSAGLAGTDDLAAALQNPSLFRTAITIDGQIIGERITGLTIQGQQIVGGIIRNPSGTVWLDLTQGEGYIPRLIGSAGNGAYYGLEQGTITVQGAQQSGMRFYRLMNVTPPFADIEGDYFQILRNNSSSYAYVRLRAIDGDGNDVYVDLFGDSGTVNGIGNILQVRAGSAKPVILQLTENGDLAIPGQIKVGGTSGVGGTGGITGGRIEKGGNFVSEGGGFYAQLNGQNVAYIAQDGTVHGYNIDGTTVNATTINASDEIKGKTFKQPDGLSMFSAFDGGATVLTCNYTNSLVIGWAEPTSGGGITIHHIVDFGHDNVSSFHGNINLNGYTILNQSDRRLKKYITNSKEQALPILDAIPMRQYTYKVGAPGALPGKKVRFGQIAQELADVYPEAVVHDEDKDDWYIDKIALIDLLIKGMQELSAKVTALEKKLRKEHANAG